MQNLWQLTLSFATSQMIVKEVKIWAKLMHPNVLPLLGIFVDHVNATPNLVSEWMVNGTASRYMRDFPRGGRKTFQVVSEDSILY